MKVILSVEPIRYPLTGVGRYTFELARHLATRSDIEDLAYFFGDRFLEGLPVAGDGASSGASAIRRLKLFLAKNRALLEVHRYLSQRRRGKALTGRKDYLYHGPNFYLPPFAGRSVVTLHDLSILTMPQFHPAERVNFMHKEIELAVERATLLITDAEYTRNEVAAYFGWPLDKVKVAPLASGPEFRPRSTAETAETMARHGLTHGGYTLYAGTIEPRKNLVRLLSAYERLPQTLRSRYPLILTGYKGWKNEETMALLDKGRREGWARYLGFAPAEDLPVLFSGARLFAFPSLYEGFGLPVLEAMGSGIPVITSTSSTLPEVAGDAAGLCAPEDVEGLTELLRRGLEDETWRSSARELGLAQAARFSWQRCAEDTAAIYREALAA